MASPSGGGGAEQLRLGANGVDVIDELCEASVFAEAAKYLGGARQLRLSSDAKLRFYALFKQATVGPCRAPRPSLLAMRERAKWDAWSAMGSMSKDEAIVRYVAELEKVAPSWRAESGVARADADADSDSEAGGGEEEGGMQQPQSRPVYEAEAPLSQLSAADKTIWLWAGQGSLEGVAAAVAGGVGVDARDAEGRSALHWAVDRAHAKLTQHLLAELGADPNARDADGATPLHYAALCEHVELARLLLQHGADAGLADDAGDTPAEAMRSIKGLPDDVKDMMERSKKKSE